MSKIPKVIHYSWFGQSPMPKIFEICYSSWKKHCPDYEIVFWSLDNFEFNDNDYLKKTHELKKYAFFNDLARLMIIQKYGGIYLDVDVEIVKNFDDLLENDFFMGFESDEYINTGNGFGSVKNNPVLKEIIDFYNSEANKIDKKYKFSTAPKNETKIIESLGLEIVNKKQSFLGGVIYDSSTFCPKRIANKYLITPDTYSIHHFAGSWLPRKVKIYNYITSRIEKIANHLFREKTAKFLSINLSRITKIIFFPMKTAFKILGGNNAR